jgi:integrase/recombinase XerD
MGELPSYTPPKTLPKYYNKEEVLAVLDKAKNHNKRNYLLLLVMFRTGLRVSEIVNLEKKDIKDGNIIVRQGKGKKDRVIPIEKELENILGFYLDGLQPKDKLFKLTTRRIQDICHKYGGNDLHTHMLRHSFAVYCLKNGMNLRSLQKMLGHSNLNTTQIYLDVVGEDVKEDFEKIKW